MRKHGKASLVMKRSVLEVLLEMPWKQLSKIINLKKDCVDTWTMCVDVACNIYLIIYKSYFRKDSFQI